MLRVVDPEPDLAARVPLVDIDPVQVVGRLRLLEDRRVDRLVVADPVPQAGRDRVQGPPEGRPGPVKAELDGRAYEGQPVSMGNPHLVVRLDSREELAALDLTADPIVADADFPTGVNLEFYVPGATGSGGGGLPALEMRVRLATSSSRPGISAQPPARNS